VSKMPRTPNTQMTGRTVYDQFMWTLSARTYLYTVFNPKPNPIYRTDPNPNPTDPIKTDILPYRPFELAETWNEVVSSECISMKSRVRLSVLSTKRLWASCSHSHRPPARAKSINRSRSRVNSKLTTSCGFLLVHRRSRDSSRSVGAGMGLVLVLARKCSYHRSGLAGREFDLRLA